ncbi:cytochrome P450 [Boletus coccyginus]|nr:cytochrome P450 [Boletus coccyginus]
MFLQAFECISTADNLIGVAAAATTVIFLYKGCRAALASKNAIPLLPGPPARWFWDNALPSVNIAGTLADWVSKYASLVTLRQDSPITVVVRRVDAAAEIMEKEGSVFVDRPQSVAAGELLSQGFQSLLLDSGERLRRFRKATHTHLQRKAVKAYRDTQQENAKNVTMEILDAPKNHRARALRLKYISGYGPELKEDHDFEIPLFGEQMERVRSETEKNCCGNPLIRTFLEYSNEHGLSKDEMAYLAGNLYGDGSGTNAVVITNVIRAAACYPEAQRRVQGELDMVVGRDKIPTWEDYKWLPQVRAFVLETLRWRPVIPIGFEHGTTQDIAWKDQRIPAGATVPGCHWTESQDPVAFAEPEKFDPQRWIDANGRLRNHMSVYPYGFGRGAPGQVEHLANESLCITLALLLWSFRIVERPDARIAQAALFDVEFIPRMEEGRLKALLSEKVTWMCQIA